MMILTSRAALFAVLAGLLGGCSRAPTEEAAPKSATTVPPTATVLPTASEPLPFCGGNISDWCPSPPGDPCGEHKDQASCKADARCKGMRYRGESLVACKYDDRGFASNCPSVGCVSR